jgi:hypothetical protein
MIAVVRSIAGFVAGYFAVVALTTLGFNVWLGRQPTPDDGVLLVAAGTLVAVVSGFAGGSLAAAIGGRRAIGFAVAAPLIVESTWLLFLRARPERPTWYHAMGALILIASTVGGAFTRRPRTSAAAES